MGKTGKSLVLALLLAGGTTGAMAQEMAVRHGVVVQMTPIQLANDSEAGKTGESIGSQAGVTASEMAPRGLQGLGMTIGSTLGRMFGRKAGSSLGGATGYLVIIRMNKGREIAVKRTAASLKSNGIVVGSRVEIIGSGDDMQLVGESQ
jgi:hypothetical protein